MKKAPGAPKRGKSAYICYTIAKRAEVKEQMGPEAKVRAAPAALALLGVGRVMP
jgi:hypothetical protein